MSVRVGALVLAALILPAVPAAAEVPVAGISIGAPIGTVVATLGPPADVASLDSGNRFGFAGGPAVYVDDDARVLAIDVRTGSPRVEVDGTSRTFAIGAYSLPRAEAELADVAEFAVAGLRSYRLAPRRDLVLGFSTPSNRLVRLVYGEPGQLVRLGLLPGDAAAKAIPYRAPAPRHTAPDAATADTQTTAGVQATVYRLDVDQGGAVTQVAVAVPSAVPAFDAAYEARLQTRRYAAATLGGRPIAATVFVEVRH